MHSLIHESACFHNPPKLNSQTNTDIEISGRKKEIQQDKQKQEGKRASRIKWNSVKGSVYRA